MEETLQHAKKHLRDNWEKGTNCPCCGQFVKLYKRPLHHSMAACLVKLYRLDPSGKEFFHVGEIQTGLMTTGGGDFAKLAYWGMVEEMPKTPEMPARTSGYWRITPTGVNFVLGSYRAPRRALIYNGKLIGFDQETVSVHEALGDSFSYEELMK